MAMLTFLLPVVLIPIIWRAALFLRTSGLTRVGAIVTATGVSLLLLALCWMAPTPLQWNAVLLANALVLAGAVTSAVGMWRVLQADKRRRGS